MEESLARDVERQRVAAKASGQRRSDKAPRSRTVSPAPMDVIDEETDDSTHAATVSAGVTYLVKITHLGPIWSPFEGLQCSGYPVALVLTRRHTGLLCTHRCLTCTSFGAMQAGEQLVIRTAQQRAEVMPGRAARQSQCRHQSQTCRTRSSCAASACSQCTGPWASAAAISALVTSSLIRHNPFQSGYMVCTHHTSSGFLKQFDNVQLPLPQVLCRMCDPGGGSARSQRPTERRAAASAEPSILPGVPPEGCISGRHRSEKSGQCICPQVRGHHTLWPSPDAAISFCISVNRALLVISVFV